ncbi:integral membrane [Trichoderma arundinaceum]|uniref:Integral membrane n=1 Tax=Trichoderma arundinaceum TaxID=490622 RepID=A0A395NU70_TRIAR|nr:integral membrane [Trichoderma arundinaceum]
MSGDRAPRFSGVGEEDGAAGPTPLPMIEVEFPPITGSGLDVVILSVLLPLLATAWTGLRIWTRRLRGISLLFLEDILCYISLLAFWGVSIGYICSFAKNSIVAMLKRIFFTQSYAWIANLIMGLNVVWMLQTILTSFLVCQPVNVNWDPTVQGHCGNGRVAYALFSIFDIITDVAIIILPLRLLARLQMEKIYKIALIGVFAFGLVTVVCTAIRLRSYFILDIRDLTFSGITVMITGVIQLCVAIIVATAPLLRPVLDRTIGRWLSLSIARSSPHSPSDGSAPMGGSQANKPTNTSLQNGIHTRSILSPRVNKMFQRITESEEHLNWELGVMSSDKGKTSTHVGSDGEINGEIEIAPMGHIMITRSTEITQHQRAP